MKKKVKRDKNNYQHNNNILQENDFDQQKADSNLKKILAPS